MSRNSFIFSSIFLSLGCVSRYSCKSSAANWYVDIFFSNISLSVNAVTAFSAVEWFAEGREHCAGFKSLIGGVDGRVVLLKGHKRHRVRSFIGKFGNSVLFGNNICNFQFHSPFQFFERYSSLHNMPSVITLLRRKKSAA